MESGTSLAKRKEYIMAVIDLSAYEVTKVAMSIKYALESLQEGNVEACIDSLNNAFWYIGTSVEELNKLDEDEVYK